MVSREQSLPTLCPQTSKKARVQSDRWFCLALLLFTETPREPRVPKDKGWASLVSRVDWSVRSQLVRLGSGRQPAAPLGPPPHLRPLC